MESKYFTTLTKIVNELRNHDPTIRNLRASKQTCKTLGTQTFQRLIQQDITRMQQAMLLAQQQMGLSLEEAMQACAEVETAEVKQKYLAGCNAHSLGDKLAAKKAWIEAAGCKSADALVQLGCYFVRGFGFIHSELLGQACFVRALRDGVFKLENEIIARVSMANVDLLPSAITEAEVLSEAILDIIRFDRVIRSEDCEFATPGRPIVFRFLVAPSFPRSVCEGVNIVGFWEAVLPDSLSNNEKAHLIKYPLQQKAAKDLRWILDKKELDVNIRDIFSEEISFLSQVEGPDSFCERLIKAGFVSGVLRHV